MRNRKANNIVRTHMWMQTLLSSLHIIAPVSLFLWIWRPLWGKKASISSSKSDLKRKLKRYLTKQLIIATQLITASGIHLKSVQEHFCFQHHMPMCRVSESMIGPRRPIGTVRLRERPIRISPLLIISQQQTRSTCLVNYFTFYLP